MPKEENGTERTLMLTCKFHENLRFLLLILLLKGYRQSFMYSRFVPILTGINVEKRPKSFVSKMPTATSVLQGSQKSTDIKQEELLNMEVFVIRIYPCVSCLSVTQSSGAQWDWSFRQCRLPWRLERYLMK